MVQNLAVSIISDTSARVSWSMPAVSGVDINGYEVDVRRYDQVVSQEKVGLSADARVLSITSLSEWCAILPAC